MNIRVVLDTNVLLSAILFGGTPAQLLDAGFEGAFLLLISPAILVELERKFAGKFKLPPEEIRSRLFPLRNLAHTVLPAEAIVNVCRDPDDNRILECAASGNADVIASGDKDLLTLVSFRGIQILTVRQLLDKINNQPSLQLP